MRFDDAINETEGDPIQLLESFNPETATNSEMKQLIIHLKSQFKTRYNYLVGEWANAHRAKSTRNGQFVSSKEVIEYLGKKI